MGLLVFDKIVDEGTVEAANTLYVGSGQTYSKIQYAIENATPGDTIRVFKGTYYENVVIDKSISLIGNGTTNTIIDGGDTKNVIEIRADWVNVSFCKITGSSTIQSPSGIYVVNSENCSIHDNNITGNYFGVYFSYSDWNIVNNNTFYMNKRLDIQMEWSDHLTVFNNYFTCRDDGLNFYYSYYSKFFNNTLDCRIYAGTGFIMLHGGYHNIFNNTFYGSYYPIHLYFGEYNRIYNNTCFGAYFAFNLDLSDHNLIFSNEATLCSGLIYLLRSKYNLIYENNLINSGNAINFNSETYYNYVYHNNFINLSFTTSAKGYNFYNNSNQEGNYWDDYTGLDNGANGRVAGDGIGDTNIPHPHAEADNYPYVYSSGWLRPGYPSLMDPGDIDLDGTYTISWHITNRTKGYILEESESITFDTSKIIYNGSNMNFEINNKSNGTYYYRLKAYNENRLNYYESNWSNIVDIIVDHPPSAPNNLTITDVGGHNISLAWQFNPESDINGYFILMNNTNADASGPYHCVQAVSALNNQSEITNLIEVTTYYFVVIAFDTILSNSTYSNIVNTTTLDVTPPATPTGLMATAISRSEILLTWNANSEPDLAGYQIYINNTDWGSARMLAYHKFHKIFGTDTSYTVAGLAEEVAYGFTIAAFDEVPQESWESDPAWATTLDETPPNSPTSLIVFHPTVNSLTLSWNANSEADVVGYTINRSNSINGPFSTIGPGIISGTQFIDTDLYENTRYYYKIKAVDDANLESDFSEIAFGTTLPSPKPPEINNSIPDFEILEDTIDDSSINLYYWFKDINNDPLIFDCTGNAHIDIIIHPGNGTVILTPEKDWNGFETLTFYANDSYYEISDEVKVIVLPVNDAPTNPRIILAEMIYYEGRAQPASGKATDVDIPYGDKLTFNWYLNDTKLIGSGQEINLSLPAGWHEITLNVSDLTGAWCSKTVEVMILSSPDNDDGKDNDKENDTKDDNNGDEKESTPQSGSGIFYAIIGVVVIIIILVIVILILMKKKDIIGKTQMEETQELQEPKTTIEEPIVALPPSDVQPEEKSSIEPQIQQPVIAAQPAPSQQTEPTSIQPIVASQQSQLPQPQQPPQQNICPSCGQKPTLIPQNNRYYCYQCKKYE